ncbi:hypothetical protein NGM37_38995, partial [Streptomyces sp. TRM76130]|nr:hypothetical protein [Streptomyces sp. TRM76130]
MFHVTRSLGAAALCAAALASLPATPTAAATAPASAPIATGSAAPVSAADRFAPPPVRDEDRAYHLTVT